MMNTPLGGPWRVGRNLFVGTVLAGCLVSLSACGGSSGTVTADSVAGRPPAASRATGSVRFQIAWPDSPGGRFIPDNANRIVVHVSGQDFSPPRSVIVNRAANMSGGTEEVTLSDIPAGLHRWISAEAREVPMSIGDSTVIASPTNGQLVEGDRLAAGRMLQAVPIFEGVRLDASIELEVATTPDPGVTNLSVDIQQVITDAYPMVLLIKSVADQNGNPIANLNPANLRLYETGRSGVEMEAPIVDVRTADEAATAASIAMVLDRSGSMNGSPMSSLKSAANTFVDYLQAGNAAEVISFADSVTVDQGFTTDHNLLKQAINRLNANGGTALLDALAQGINTAWNQGGRAAVVAMTDGGDNSSYFYSEQGLITLATDKSIPVYTVGLRGFDFSPTLLRNVAQRTRGLYYETPTVAQLETIYQSIAGHLAAQVQVTFISPDMTPYPEQRQLRLVYDYGSIHGQAVSHYVYNGTAGPAPLLNLSGRGTLTDDDPLDTYNCPYHDLEFTATRDGRVTISMRRTGDSGSVSDPYLQLFQGNQIIAYNDDYNYLDAQISFDAEVGVSYVARFTTYANTDRGSYSYEILEESPQARSAVQPDSARPASASKPPRGSHR